MKKILFLIFLVIFAVTFFTKTNYRGIDQIDQTVLQQPVQKELENKDIIKFSKAGYDYELTPLFDYEINGLVVHSQKYDAWYSMHERDKVFVVDLCLIWGNNVKNKAYQDKNLKFRQDFRFCFWDFLGPIKFSGQEISNNHLLVSNEEHRKIAKNISDGDQVRIKGKLVSVKGLSQNEQGEYFMMESSTKREDSGGGACEIILVEEVEILKKGNQVSHILNLVSLIAMGLLVVISIIQFLFDVFKKPPSQPKESKQDAGIAQKEKPKRKNSKNILAK